MPNSFFQFKQFRVNQERSGMKVTTDACLFGAWLAGKIMDEENEPQHVLDIGTGTGLLALMIAQATTNSQIEGVDFNQDAHLESEENFSASPWKKRLVSIHSSIQEFSTKKSYDLIVCNPPFFGKNLKGKHSKKNQAIHADHLTMEELSESVNRLLSDKGTAWILYPEWEMKAFSKWMEKSELHLNEQILVRNKAEAPVFRMMAGFSRENIPPSNDELLIRQEDGKYSDDFSSLLEEYYL